MSATKTKASRPDDETQPVVPQIAPPDIGQGHPNFFPMQAVLEIKGSLGEIKANIEHLTKSVDGIKTKVDDLVRWKNLILGGAFVIGMLVSGAAWMMSKFSIEITPKPANTQTLPTAASTTPQPGKAP